MRISDWSSDVCSSDLTMIEALPAAVAEVPDLLYVVLGATHPNLVAHEGEAYRDRLKALAHDLGVGNNIAFIDAFVEQGALIAYLQAAEIGRASCRARVCQSR